MISQQFPKGRVLYSEYGWFPWKQCFYISKYGTADNSEIMHLSTNEIDGVGPKRIKKEAALDLIKSCMQSEGAEQVESSGFVYVPLQVDVNDFKFGLARFVNNGEFLDFIDSLVLNDTEVLARNHPVNKNPINVSSWPR